MYKTGYTMATMKLDIQDIEDIAELARLHFTEEEKALYAEQLSVVLDYVEMLNEVDTTGVEETCQVTGLEDVVREDVFEKCDEDVRKNIIAQFPVKSGNLLKVKGVFSDNV
jgi:aspartyl-tRNA(Asn)/glutamyl-tRNA(Gln) amidotransferase subunit C